MISKNCKQAKKIVSTNGIIGLPTETVYGLAGNAFSEEAIDKIYKLKNRPSNNPLIVHISSINELNKVAVDIPELAYKLAKFFWPGPLTMVLKKHPSIPYSVTSGKETVAVRVPNHPLCLKLLQSIDFPLVAPSANPFGNVSPTNAKHVANYFGKKLEFVLDGGSCEKGVESTIIGFENNQPTLYRYGSVSVEAIQEVCGKLNFDRFNDEKPIAPGMFSRHYSPKTKFVVTEDIENAIENNKGLKKGLLLFDKEITSKEPYIKELLSTSGNLDEAAKNLYSAMIRLDAQQLDVILAQFVPDKGVGKAINDRLKRASQK
jgi:L-threonylcarbamoyladenylate synthase